SSNMRTSPRITGSHRNLSARPEKPARGNGRLQRLARRALFVHGGQISTTTAVKWARCELMWGERSRGDFSRAARRALASLGAVRVGRSPKGRGRPILWRLKPE